MSKITRTTWWTRARYMVDHHRRWVVSISTLLFMGLTHFGFNLGDLAYCVLATLSLGKFFILLYLSLSLNRLCRTSWTGHIRSARMCSTIRPEGEWKRKLGGHALQASPFLCFKSQLFDYEVPLT
jgi:hypothetical protein